MLTKEEKQKLIDDRVNKIFYEYINLAHDLEKVYDNDLSKPTENIINVLKVSDKSIDKVFKNFNEGLRIRKKNEDNNKEIMDMSNFSIALMLGNKFNEMGEILKKTTNKSKKK